MSTLKVTPETCSLRPGEQQQFRVGDLEAPRGLQWSIDPQGTENGVITDTGIYTAPPSASTVLNVTVKAQADELTGTASVTVEPSAQASTATGGPQHASETAKSAAETSNANASTDATPAVTVAAPPTAVAPTNNSGATITVDPASVVLVSGATKQFQALDGSGKAIDAAWSLLGTGGLPADVVGSIGASTGAYTAPSEVSSERTVIVQAIATNNAISRAFIVLTPGAVRLVPGEVALRAKEQQLFRVLVQGDPNGPAHWQTSPSSGLLTPNAGNPSATVVYEAPAVIAEDTKIVVIATSDKTQVVGYANVTLIADTWVGWGPRRIGIWLIVLAVIVPLLYLRWPPPSPSDRTRLTAAVGAQHAANTVLQEREDAVKKLEASLTQTRQKAAARTPGNADLDRELQNQTDTLTASLATANESLIAAQRDIQTKQFAVDEEQAALIASKTDERVLFMLVLLAGALGSFVHTTRSFVDFVGNRRLCPSWGWW